MQGDGGGSTSQLVSQGGTVTDTFSYTVAGDLLSRTGTTVIPWQFGAQDGLYTPTDDDALPTGLYAGVLTDGGDGWDPDAGSYAVTPEQLNAAIGFMFGGIVGILPRNNFVERSLNIDKLSACIGCCGLKMLADTPGAKTVSWLAALFGGSVKCDSYDVDLEPLKLQTPAKVLWKTLSEKLKVKIGGRSYTPDDLPDAFKDAALEELRSRLDPEIQKSLEEYDKWNKDAKKVLGGWGCIDPGACISGCAVGFLLQEEQNRSIYPWQTCGIGTDLQGCYECCEERRIAGKMSGIGFSRCYVGCRMAGESE
ncbi:MAG: hypothetical protein KF857_06230 [Fimbriimonadaceae bacterium]|nr:hypothetical protein [Fimbriimonadaceae bacterium]